MLLLGIPGRTRSVGQEVCKLGKATVLIREAYGPWRILPMVSLSVSSYRREEDRIHIRDMLGAKAAEGRNRCRP